MSLFIPLVLSSFPLGYRTDVCLNDSDLDFLRSSIYNQWLQVINEGCPDIGCLVSTSSLPITRYHEISHQLNHSCLWAKSNRILPRSLFINSCRLNSHRISDRCLVPLIFPMRNVLAYPNIYWRLVRPNEPADVGPLHRDSWFWELNSSFTKPAYPFLRYKVWVPIFTELGLNGLLVEPGSHLRTDINWSGELRHGIMKPVLLSPLSSLSPELVNISPGSCIIFDDNLIHGGSLNCAVTLVLVLNLLLS